MWVQVCGSRGAGVYTAPMVEPEDNLRYQPSGTFHVFVLRQGLSLVWNCRVDQSSWPRSFQGSTWPTSHLASAVIEDTCHQPDLWCGFQGSELRLPRLWGDSSAPRSFPSPTCPTFFQPQFTNPCYKTAMLIQQDFLKCKTTAVQYKYNIRTEEPEVNVEGSCWHCGEKHLGVP